MATEKQKIHFWSDEETIFMLQQLKELNILKYLDGRKTRNGKIFIKTSERLNEAGFIRTAEQVRVRWKHLKHNYHNVKKTDEYNRVWPFCDILEELLGNNILSKAGDHDVDIGLNSDCLMDVTSAVSDCVGVSAPAHPSMDPALRDHDYCMVGSRKNVQDKTTQCGDFRYSMLQNNSDALRHTGISLEVFDILVSTLEKNVSNAFPMSVQDQVLMTLMKLRTNHVTGYLSKQFYISESMASKIISYWIDKLDEVLRPLIPWLPRETIQATMPETFKEKFPNTTCIVHCTDCLLQKNQDLDSKGESYSHYYDKMKYLVAVAPCGLIMFVSTAYLGQCTDKYITFESGLLDYLMPGDEVMAEHGSSIKDLLFNEKNVNLVMYSFRNEEQDTYIGQTAHVIVDVERAITRLKVYKILTQVVSNTMALQINKILRICSALVNLREEFIRDSH